MKKEGEPQLPRIEKVPSVPKTSVEYLSPESARQQFQLSQETGISKNYFNEVVQLIGHSSWTHLVRGEEDPYYTPPGEDERFLQIIISKLPDRLATFPTYTEHVSKWLEGFNRPNEFNDTRAREEDVFLDRAQESIKEIDNLVLQIRSFADKDLTNIEVLKELDSLFLQIQHLVFGSED